MNFLKIDIPKLQPFLTKKEVAGLLHVSMHTVDRERQKGLLNGVRIGGSVRFYYPDIEEYISTIRQQKRRK